MEREFYVSKDGTKVLFVAPITELEYIDNMDKFKYKYDHLLVIGNGFDLNLGLPTSYRNFVESRIFKKMYVKRMQEKLAKGNAQPSLIDYLYGKKFSDRWYDIEQSLLDYVSKRPDGSFINNIEEDKRDYELICQTLVEYLASLFKTGNDLKQSKMMRESSSGQLLQKISSERNVVYTFNYTPISLILDAVLGHVSLKTINLHGEVKEITIFKGTIKDSAIILGIETDDMNNIAPGYSFMLKSNNSAYKSSNLAFDLMNSCNVIFFGHSLNQMDFGYFKGFFKMLESNTDKERALTIITKNEKSRVTLLDNIRKMGISVRDIYSHINVNFILTDKLNSRESDDSRLFNELLENFEKSSCF